jgi:hypothetical protein
VIKTLYKQIRKKLLPPSRVFVLFVPCDEYGDSDPMKILAPLVQEVLGHDHSVVLGELIPTDISELLVRLNITRAPTRIVLFAHPTKQNHAFATNGLGGSAAIHASWWRGIRKYQIFMATWVSFEDEIRAFLGSVKGRELWVGLCADTVTATSESTSATGLFHRLRAHYENALANIGDTYDARQGDLLNVGYLQGCLESLRVSEHD